jgi:truncated hemoglobin YjbI
MGSFMHGGPGELNIRRKADAAFREEIRNAGLYDAIWQRRDRRFSSREGRGPRNGSGSVGARIGIRLATARVRDKKGMEHRQFLTHPEAHRRFAGSDVFLHIGGAAAVDTLINGLYDRIEIDAALRPMFGRDTTNERAAQKRFFTEWLGGERDYSDHAHLPLKHRHDLLPITHALAEKWLAHFRSSLDSAVSNADARRAIYDDVHLLATALVNEGQPPSALRARPHGTCLRYKPAIDSLGLARRGDATELRALLERASLMSSRRLHMPRLFCSWLHSGDARLSSSSSSAAASM